MHTSQALGGVERDEFACCLEDGSTDLGLLGARAARCCFLLSMCTSVCI